MRSHVTSLGVALIAVQLATLLLACAAAPTPPTPEPTRCPAHMTASGGACYDEVAVFLDCDGGRKPNGKPCSESGAAIGGSCGCAAGDLLCAMRCSAGGGKR